jgi:hypothetical protein
MSSIVISGDTSGSITLAAPAVAGTYTQTLPKITGTIATLDSGTAVASTSGTSIDFTSLPANIRRITVMFNGVSTGGTSIPIVQLGSGSVVTSGYLGSATLVDGSAPTYGGTNISAGFNLSANSMSAAYLISGNMILTLIGSNTWVCNYNGATSTTARSFTTAGNIALSGSLDRVRITTVNGTDTFDAGSINILYE